VRDTLVAHARRTGVQIVTAATVTGIEPSATGWRIARQDAAPLEADRVILATGGLSVPRTGSDGLGLRIAERHGHVINPTYPALTPLTSNRFGAGLSGISLPVTITARSPRRSAQASGGFLFTHRGYSGPAVLDVSHVAVRSLVEPGERARIVVRWSTLSEREWEQTLQPKGARTVAAAVAGVLPHRLAEALVAEADVEPDRALSQLTRGQRRRVIDMLLGGVLPWHADEGYSKAEVTGGGVSLAEIDPGTMESRRCRGLFLCGEMLDAFGPIGGYNFFWAWATGRAAGTGAAR
jgi:predicted Rossmann fold flavoprotein